MAILSVLFPTPPSVLGTLFKEAIGYEYQPAGTPAELQEPAGLGAALEPGALPEFAPSSVAPAPKAPAPLLSKILGTPEAPAADPAPVAASSSPVPPVAGIPQSSALPGWLQPEPAPSLEIPAAPLPPMSAMQPAGALSADWNKPLDIGGMKAAPDSPVPTSKMPLSTALAAKDFKQQHGGAPDSASKSDSAKMKDLGAGVNLPRGAPQRTPEQERFFAAHKSEFDPNSRVDVAKMKKLKLKSAGFGILA